MLIMKYLAHGGVKGQQGSKKEQELTAKTYKTYFMEEGELQKEFANGESKICIARDQIEHLIERAHNYNGTHFDPANTTKQIFKSPYWSLSISQDTN